MSEESKNEKNWYKEHGKGGTVNSMACLPLLLPPFSPYFLNLQSLSRAKLQGGDSGVFAEAERRQSWRTAAVCGWLPWWISDRKSVWELMLLVEQNFLYTFCPVAGGWGMQTLRRESRGEGRAWKSRWLHLLTPVWVLLHNDKREPKLQHDQLAWL